LEGDDLVRAGDHSMDLEFSVLIGMNVAVQVRSLQRRIAGEKRHDGSGRRLAVAVEGRTLYGGAITANFDKETAGQRTKACICHVLVRIASHRADIDVLRALAGALNGDE